MTEAMETFEYTLRRSAETVFYLKILRACAEVVAVRYLLLFSGTTARFFISYSSAIGAQRLLIAKVLFSQ